MRKEIVLAGYSTVRHLCDEPTNGGYGVIPLARSAEYFWTGVIQKVTKAEYRWPVLQQRGT